MTIVWGSVSGLLFGILLVSLMEVRGKRKRAKARTALYVQELEDRLASLNETVASLNQIIAGGSSSIPGATSFNFLMSSIRLMCCECGQPADMSLKPAMMPLCTSCYHDKYDGISDEEFEAYRSKLL